MPLDRFPRTARGNAHLLVVISDRAPGRKGIAQPEAVFGRDRVGEIGERRGALVGCDHQVGVVVVVAHHLGRRHQLAADEVVGQVQQPAQEGLVAGDALLQERIAVGGRGRALDHEAALGAHGHDHRVLDHLRLHQSQHFRAEVLAPV